MYINKVSLRMVKENKIQYEPKQIENCFDVIELINKFEDLENLSTENVILICMNTKNKPINYSYISKGSINECQVDLKEIFKTVIMSNATRFILIHNHPSGDATPSNIDIQITKKIVECCKMMQIELLDHIVIGENKSYKSIIQILNSIENK